MKQEWTRLKDKPSVIDLPDECTETVKIYIEWLYLDKNPIKRHKKGKEMQAGDSEKIYVLLAKAYVFGEKIIDPKYKNEMLINIGEALAFSIYFRVRKYQHYLQRHPFKFSASAFACHRVWIAARR